MHRLSALLQACNCPPNVGEKLMYTKSGGKIREQRVRLGCDSLTSNDNDGVVSHLNTSAAPGEYH